MCLPRIGWNAVCAATVLVIMSYGVAANEVVTIVSPAGFEDVEGGGSSGSGPITSTFGNRYQNMHLASDFDSLAPGYNKIVGMAWRPDESLNEPLTITNEYIEIRLSTTSKTMDDLSSFFAENIGDDETLVYAGELILSTDGAGPAPKAFDYVVDFQTPFIYDPTAGNLLYEFRLRNADYQWQRDFATFPPPAGRRRVQGTPRIEYPEDGMTQESGVIQTQVPVTQFTIIPEPSTFILAALGIGLALGCLRRR